MWRVLPMRRLRKLWNTRRWGFPGEYAEATVNWRASSWLHKLIIIGWYWGFMKYCGKSMPNIPRNPSAHSVHVPLISFWFLLSSYSKIIDEKGIKQVFSHTSQRFKKIAINIRKYKNHPSTIMTFKTIFCNKLLQLWGRKGFICWF